MGASGIMIFWWV